MFLFRLILLSAAALWAHLHLFDEGRLFFGVERENTSQNFRSFSRFATLGFFELGADRAWLQFVNYFGDKRQHRKHYPELFSFLERAQLLDPYFLQVYQRIGLLSSLTENRSEQVLSLLAEGQERQPRDWLIPFTRASLLMQNKDRLAEAARVMKIAAGCSGAPEYLGLLSVRLATAGGDLEAALLVVAQLEHEASDEASLEILAERRRQIHFEKDLRAFDRATSLFRETRQGESVDLETLRKDNIELPKHDPWGERYQIGEEGEVTSRSLAKRLKLPKE